MIKENKFLLSRLALISTYISAILLMCLPVTFLARWSAVACIPTAVESSFLRAVGAPRSLLRLLSGDVNGSLLLSFALQSNLVDDAILVLLER